MSGRSGRKSRVLFALYDPESSCWKTLQQSLPLGNLPEQSATWPRSGMWDSGAVYALPTLAPPTDEPEYSSLLTPRATRRGSATETTALLPTPDAYEGSRGGSQHPDKRKAAGHSPYLACVAEHLLPTPTVSDGNGAGAHGAGGSDLRTAISLLPTPTATPYGNNQSPSPGAAVRPSLNGVFTNPLLDDGSEPSDDAPPLPLNPDETERLAYPPDLRSG